MNKAVKTFNVRIADFETTNIWLMEPTEKSVIISVLKRPFLKHLKYLNYELQNCDTREFSTAFSYLRLYLAY